MKKKDAIMNDWIKIILTRDSVCAGDDCDCPHEKIFKFYPDQRLSEVASKIRNERYLPTIQGGKATWFIYIGNEPICIITEQDKDIVFINGKDYKIEEKQSNGILRIEVKYFAQDNPEYIMKKIEEGNVPNNWNKFV
jgi:hypothetical protein